MDKNGTVAGKVPVHFNFDHVEHHSVTGFCVRFNDETIYSGNEIPEQLVLDTDAISDGLYDLHMKFNLKNGSMANETIQVHVENMWRISDEQLPPLALSWFGSIDRSKTTEVSAGWDYLEEDDDPLFGDRERRVRRENTSEYLIWETPFVESFHIRVYAATDQLDGMLYLAHSSDSHEWTDVPFATTIERISDDGMYLLHVSGVVPGSTDASLFKLTIAENELLANEVQVGHAEIVGRKMARE